MTVSENLLFQMYQMMDSAKLPDIGTASASEKNSGKNDFRSLMDQTRKDISKSDQPADKTQGTDDAPAKKTDETEEPTLQKTNYVDASAYLYRPEILVETQVASAPAAQISVVSDGAVPVEQIPEVFVDAAPLVVQTPVDSQPVSEQSAELPVDTQPAADVATGMEQPVVQAEPEQTLQNETAFTKQDTQDDTPDLSGQVVSSQQPLFREVPSAPLKVGESYQLDTASDQMDVELADTIAQAVDAGAEKIEIQLMPQQLGKLVVEMTRTSDGALQIVFHAANAKSAGLLSQHLDSLNAALQNIGQNQVHVEVQRNQESASSQQQPFQQADPDGRGQQHQQQQQQQPRTKSDDFLQQLRLGLFPLEETI